VRLANFDVLLYCCFYVAVCGRVFFSHFKRRSRECLWWCHCVSPTRSRCQKVRRRRK
jgi:hypothetical protein